MKTKLTILSLLLLTACSHKITTRSNPVSGRIGAENALLREATAYCQSKGKLLSEYDVASYDEESSEFTASVHCK